jgi:SAM-dependent methyltransferase
MFNLDDSLNGLLNAYWIRPEAAIHRTLDILQMKKVSFKKPILDLGCGNGVFSFLFFGGKFNSDFDVYQWVPNTTNFIKGRDIYNQSTKYQPKIVKKPKIKVDVGIDWKQSLLDNADKLKLYDKTIQHDLNKKLPFEDNSFSTIFSNDMFWINKIDDLLLECNRILKKDGKLILLLPDKKFKQNLIYSDYIKDKKQKWAKILDRENYPNMKHCYTYSEWKSKFSKANLKITEHSSYLSEQFIRYSQLGLKIFSPYIIEMAKAIDPVTRRSVKKRLVSELQMLSSLYIKNYENNIKTDHQFHYFLLEKS